MQIFSWYNIIATLLMLAIVPEQHTRKSTETALSESHSSTYIIFAGHSFSVKQSERRCGHIRRLRATMSNNVHCINVSRRIHTHPKYEVKRIQTLLFWTLQLCFHDSPLCCCVRDRSHLPPALLDVCFLLQTVLDQPPLHLSVYFIITDT